MHPSAPDLVGLETVNVLPWNDQATDDIGFDARSEYAETFWLPILGPSTLLLLRNIAQRFESEPDGLVLNIASTADALGIGSRAGRNSAFHRSINRIVTFAMARTVDDTTIAVRTMLPPLHSGQIRRLNASRLRQHQRFLKERTAPNEEDVIRSTKVAGTLLRLGDSPDLVEQQLVAWGVQPQLAKTAVDRAWANKAREDMAASAMSSA